MPPVRSPVTLRSVARAARIGNAAPQDALERAARLVGDRFDVPHVQLVGSGTQALQLALTHALARTDGAPVAAPGFTCFDVASALIGANARALLYDIDPGTLTPVATSVEEACRAGARTVLLAPLYGHLPDFDDLRRIARRYDAIVIEDLAQAHGATWQGRRSGSIGDCIVLSFGRGKGWTAGSGGALLSRTQLAPPDDVEAAARILTGAAAAALLGHPLVYGIPRSLPFLELGRTVYHPPAAPARMPAAAAALLCETAAASDAEAAARKRHASDYLERLSAAGLAHTVPAVHPETDAGWLRFPVLIPDGQRAALGRDAVRLGIAPSYPVPLGRLPELRPTLVSDTACPGAEQLARELITLPTHTRAGAHTRAAAVAWVAARTQSRPTLHANA